MNYKTILVTDDHSIRTITLNRPERRNAMTPEMQTELISVMEETAASECRVLIFTGAGDAFCSGLDLSELQAMRDKTAAEHRTDAERVARLFVTLYELPMPTIAAVTWTGHCRRNRTGNDLRLHAGDARRRSSALPRCASALFRRWYRHFLRCRSETSAAAICC